jgi:hypothetical protein
MNNQKDSIEELNALEKQLLQAQKKLDLEVSFQKEANKLFEKNLKKFESYFPQIARSIIDYTPSDSFHLKVTETGHANFRPASSDNYLYSEEPIEQAQVQVSNAIENPSFTLSDYSKYNPKKKDQRIHIRYMNYLAKLLKERKESPLDKDYWMKSLPSRFPSAMIFGVGLGYHLPVLFDKCEFDYTFILEPDFEVFFASLFLYGLE